MLSGYIKQGDFRGAIEKTRRGVEYLVVEEYCCVCKEWKFYTIYSEQEVLETANKYSDNGTDPITKMGENSIKIFLANFLN